MTVMEILLIDNDRQFANLRKEFFSTDEFIVWTVSSAAEAWEVLARRNIVLILVDVRLKDDEDKRDRSGLELARELLAGGYAVIIQTAFPVTEEMLDIVRLYADVSPLQLDIVVKDEGHKAMLMAVHRMQAILRQTRTFAGNRVFVVYGHDTRLKQQTMGFIRELGLVPIDISAEPSEGRSIVEQIEYYGQVPYAVVLLTPDDLGYARKGDHVLRPRPRQNAVFELGFFRGRLGAGRVCTLVKGKLELLSDYDGILYIACDADNKWKRRLARELKTAGFAIDLERVGQE